MKKIIFTLALSLVCATALAQNVSGKCYRGFADAGYSFGLGDYEFGRFEINTSHGYQINPYIYLGAGLGFHFMSEYETPNMSIPLDVRESSVDIPLFANARVNFGKWKLTPFIDFKAGTFLTNGGGAYLNLSFGGRWALNKKNAINLLIGYGMEKLEFESFKRFLSSSSMNYSRYERKLNTEHLALKIGYEF